MSLLNIIDIHDALIKQIVERKQTIVRTAKSPSKMFDFFSCTFKEKTQVVTQTFSP